MPVFLIGRKIAEQLQVTPEIAARLNELHDIPSFPALHAKLAMVVSSPPMVYTPSIDEAPFHKVKFTASRK